MAVIRRRPDAASPLATAPSAIRSIISSAAAAPRRTVPYSTNSLTGRAPLRPEDARRTLIALDQESDARIRVLDAGGQVLVDSSRLGTARADVVSPPVVARTK